MSSGAAVDHARGLKLCRVRVVRDVAECVLSLLSLMGLVASASVLSELRRLALDSRTCEGRRKHRTVCSLMASGENV